MGYFWGLKLFSWRHLCKNTSPLLYRCQGGCLFGYFVQYSSNNPFKCKQCILGLPPRTDWRVMALASQGPFLACSSFCSILHGYTYLASQYSCKILKKSTCLMHLFKFTLQVVRIVSTAKSRSSLTVI